VRLASIYKDGAYLLLPARWFPLTAYPANRYNRTFRLTVPETFAVAGTGKSLSHRPLLPNPQRKVGGCCMFSNAQPPRPTVSFVAGRCN